MASQRPVTSLRTDTSRKGTPTCGTGAGSPPAQRRGWRGRSGLYWQNRHRMEDPMASTRRFHHVGVITDVVQPGEIYVAETKVHVTNPAAHPYRIEYLRFEPDSPVTGPVREQPHMAFAVDDLEAELAGAHVLL